MYFTEEERLVLTGLMIEHGIDPSAILFVKKRGRMFVQAPGRNAEFAFLSRKATRLDDKGQWINSVEYFVGASKADSQVTWEVLQDRFKDWLRSGV